MRVIAIDPSLRNTAFVGANINPYEPTNFLIDFVKLERTEKSSKGLVRDDDWRCARQLAEQVQAVTEKADVVIIEQPVGSQSARGSWAGGITLGILSAIRCQVIRLTPIEVKQVFTGNKHASKAHMIERAVCLFPEVEFPKSKQKGKVRINANRAEHIADAVAVMYTGLRSKDFERFCRGWVL